MPIHTSVNYYPWINPFLSIKSEEICSWDFFVEKKFTNTTDLEQEFAVQNTNAVHIMALPVMEFQDQGYKVRKIFA